MTTPNHDLERKGNPIPFEIKKISPKWEKQAKILILEGLKEHFGWLDQGKNPDLDEIIKTYLKPGQIFLIVLSDDNLIGTGALIDESDERRKIARICRMSVKKEFRHHGVASAILSRLEEFGRSHNYSSIKIETNWDWVAPIRLYRKFGYIELGISDGDMHFIKNLK